MPYTKRAYDYQYEAEQMAAERARRAGDKKQSYGKAMAGFGAAGAGLGAVLGATGSPRRKLQRALVGGGVGGLVGITLGALGTAIQHADIDDAKNVSALPEETRMKMMRARARSAEISAQEWNSERRHQELMSKGAAEHVGFLKAAGVPNFVTKAVNKGKQMLQGAERAGALRSAQNLRAQKRKVRISSGRTPDARFKRTIDEVGLDIAEGTHSDFKAKANSAMKRRLGVAGAVAGAGALGAGVGYSAS